jgi:hypothetical protein
LISVPVHFSPGVTISPVSGTETTGGETGSIACTGTFDGHRVTGTGTFGYEGVFTGITCLFDTAPLSGSYSFTVPTDAGSLHFAGHISDTRIFLLDRFELSQAGATFTGTAAIVPTTGTCLVSPATDIVIDILGSFRPASADAPVLPTATATTPPTLVLGGSVRRQPTLPVTGPTDSPGVLALLTVMCYVLGGLALTRAKRRS